MIAKAAIRLFAVASVAASAPAAHAQRSKFWRPDERVVLTSLSHVQALAATPTFLFVATTGGLGIYDHLARRWREPVTAIDGYPTDPVTRALVDPTDESIWLGTTKGLAHYQPAIHQLESLAISGGVRDLMFDAANSFRGVYVNGS